MVSLLSYIISISMVKIFAMKYEYSVDSNQGTQVGLETLVLVPALTLIMTRFFPTHIELVALGAANLIGSVFGAYPSSGSLSRTALVAAVVSQGNERHSRNDSLRENLSMSVPSPPPPPLSSCDSTEITSPPFNREERLKSTAS